MVVEAPAGATQPSNATAATRPPSHQGRRHLPGAFLIRVIVIVVVPLPPVCRTPGGWYYQRNRWARKGLSGRVWWSAPAGSPSPCGSSRSRDPRPFAGNHIRSAGTGCKRSQGVPWTRELQRRDRRWCDRTAAVCRRRRLWSMTFGVGFGASVRLTDGQPQRHGEVARVSRMERLVKPPESKRPGLRISQRHSPSARGRRRAPRRVGRWGGDLG